MAGNRRLRVLAVSCVLAVLVVALTGEHAWARARQTEARCLRPPAVATAPTMADHQIAERGSWRAHTLRAAGCGAWRQMHERRMHRRPR